MLYEKDNYKAPINMVINQTIVEYDMKSANTSLAREFHLLPEKEITRIENLPKMDREISIGLIKQRNREYSEKEKIAFCAARKMFFDQNELDDGDILSIKRDAIFVFRYVKHEQVTDNINFRMKNVYSSFLSLGVDVFYNSEKLDIKGIDDQIYEERHKEYFGGFLHDFIRRAEVTEKDKLLRYLRNFYDDYKWRRLDPGYYREFNARSQYKYLDGKYADEEYLEDLFQVDIGHNLNILLKLMRYFL